MNDGPHNEAFWEAKRAILEKDGIVTVVWQKHIKENGNGQSIIDKDIKRWRLRIV